MARSRFKQSPDYVQSLARGLRVLRAFTRDLQNARLSEIADATGLSSAVVRRLLLTLQDLGYIGSHGRDFFLTPRVLELGYSYLCSLDMRELAFHDMELLAQRVGEMCSMAVLDGNDMVYVSCIPVKRVISMVLGVGARLPAAATSTGRVVLADLSPAELASWLRAQKFHSYTPHTICTRSELKIELQRVRRQGYALAIHEIELGVCSAAVPIRDGSGRAVAALNVITPYHERAAERLRTQIVPALRATQQAIEQAVLQASWVPLQAKAAGE